MVGPGDQFGPVSDLPVEACVEEETEGLHGFGRNFLFRREAKRRVVEDTAEIADDGGEDERGGKFDWVRSNAAPRPMQHVNHGYNNWDGYPARGTAWAYVITDASGKRRSNVAKGVWP